MFLKLVGSRGQIFGRSDRRLILGGPIVRQTYPVVIDFLLKQIAYATLVLNIMVAFVQVS
jgi:hypothetical protein